MYVTDSLSVTLHNSVVDGNEAQARGGGVLLQQRSKAVLKGVTVCGNTARTGGAAYVASGSVMHCTECSVVSNDAESRGGAVAVDGARAATRTELALHRSTLVDNAAVVAAGTSCGSRECVPFTACGGEWLPDSVGVVPCRRWACRVSGCRWGARVRGSSAQRLPDDDESQHCA